MLVRCGAMIACLALMGCPSELDDPAASRPLTLPRNQVPPPARPPKPAAPAPPPPASPPTAATPRPPAVNTWRDARVGDWLEYEYHAEAGAYARAVVGESGQEELDDPPVTRTSVKLTLEVVRLEPPVAWVLVGVVPAGQAARALLFAVDAESASPVERSILHPPSEQREQVWMVADAGVPCLAWKEDHRAGDGPLIEGCDTDTAPASLVGTVSRFTHGFGFGGHHFSGELALTGLRRGAESAPNAALPPVPVLFAPRGWFLRLAGPAQPGAVTEQTEQRIVGSRVITSLRTLNPVKRQKTDPLRAGQVAIAGGEYEPTTWSVLENRSVAEVLETLASAVARPLHAGPSAPRAFARGTFRVVKDAFGGQWLADPFDPALSGLPLDGRLGQVVGEASTSVAPLWDWGTGALPAAKP